VNYGISLADIIKLTEKIAVISSIYAKHYALIYSDKQTQRLLSDIIVSHDSAHTVVRATQQVNGKGKFWAVRTL